MSVTIEREIRLSIGGVSAGELLFPTELTAGLPNGWEPTNTVGSQNLNTEFQVLENVRVEGEVLVSAPNCTIRNCEIINGRIDNFPGSTIQLGMLIENVTMIRENTAESGFPAIGYSSYTARNVKILNYEEGFRQSGWDGEFPPAHGGGPVLIENCWTNIIEPVPPPFDWHGDGTQAFGDDFLLTIRNSVFIVGPGATNAIRHPLGNTGHLVIERAIASGGAWSLDIGTTSEITDLYIERDVWVFGPISFDGGSADPYVAFLCDLDGNGQPINLEQLS